MTYWILGTSYGIDQPPEGATIFKTKKEYEKAVKKAEDYLYSDDFVSEFEAPVDEESPYPELIGKSPKFLAEEFNMKQLRSIAKNLGIKYSGKREKELTIEISLNLSKNGS